MIYELLKRNIINRNQYTNADTLALQVEFFKAANKITEEEYEELVLLLNPQPIDPVVEETI